VKIGMHLQVSPRGWLEITQEAERAGFDSVFVPEHLIMPVEMSGRPGTPHEGPSPISGDTPGWDPFVQLAWLAGQTSTIRLGTNVFNIGLRHPFVTARALTTLDLVSQGRVEFGIGASWLSEEWDAMELPFETRGRRVDESIRIIQRLFSEDVIEHEGEFFSFQPVKFRPKAVQEPWPPMLIGGDSPAALRRAAELGDGWLPMAQTIESLSSNLAKIRELREKYGRSDHRFEVTVFGVWDSSVDNLRRYEEVGVDRVLVSPWRSPKEAVDSIRRFGDEVIPHFQ
jgi:probable F420-dependent oxidoreductase